MFRSIKGLTCLEQVGEQSKIDTIKKGKDQENEGTGILTRTFGAGLI